MYRVTPAGQETAFLLANEVDAVNDIVVGPDGALWFSEESASKIGRITTAGQISEYALSPNSGPMGITVGRDGAIWFAEELTERVGRLSGGSLEVMAVPSLGSSALAILIVGLATCGWLLLRSA
jgi:virginiamycin B lyase